jgi:GT2 family glycosyltransferase
MKISVYIPCHNGQRSLPEVLAAIKRQTRPADEHLFIDDRCSDASPQIAAEYGFRVLAMKSDFGLGAGRSFALARASGDILLGVDADVVLDEGFLAEVERQFVECAELAAMCGMLIERPGANLPDCWRAEHMVQHEGDEAQWNPYMLYGHSTAGRVSALRAVGGWNRLLRSNAEDADLSARLRVAGCLTRYVPRCQAWHLRRDSLDSLLQNNWNYTYHWLVDSGRIDSLDVWQTCRMPDFWHTYLERLVREQQPDIAFITLLAVWDGMVRDLLTYQQRTNAPRALTEVIHDVCECLTLKNAENTVVSAVRGWLTRLVPTPASAAATLALPGDLLQELRRTSMQFLPEDPVYWALVAQSCRRQQASEPGSLEPGHHRVPC